MPTTHLAHQQFMQCLHILVETHPGADDLSLALLRFVAAMRACPWTCDEKLSWLEAVTQQIERIEASATQSPQPQLRLLRFPSAS